MEYSLKRIVVAIDPAITNNEQSDETGIVVAGLGHDGNGYVLEDLSGRYSANDWAKRAVDAYKRHMADRIVAEVNRGGDLVEKLLRAINPGVSYKAVRATRNKETRAEPIAALYENGRIFHVQTFPKLEDQMCNYVPNKTSKSPDRMDALVWAFTELMLSEEAGFSLKAWAV